MTTDTDRAQPPLLRVQGPADLVHAIPYLLGFHPERSLVLVGLSAAKRVVVTARTDLDELADPALLTDTVAAMMRGGAQRVVGVVYADDAPVAGAELPWWEVADDLHAAAGRLGAAVDEVALVADGPGGRRLWSYDCAEPACCPPDGRPLDATSPVAAAAAYAGMVALPDRASLGALLAPALDPATVPELLADLRAADDDAVRAGVAGDDARASRSAVRALFAAARAADAPGWTGELGRPRLVRFGSALRRYAVRDAVWLGIDDGRIDGRGLWRALATALPAPYDAAPLFLFAWASYRAGDGAFASIAAQRALDSDPGYSAADLIMAALAQAIAPSRLPRLRGPRGGPATAAPRGGRRAGAGRTPR